jgi:hypothetical protein
VGPSGQPLLDAHPDHVAHVELGEWVVMPNQMHGVIVIAGKGEASPASTSLTENLTPGGARLQDEEAARDASPLPNSRRFVKKIP